MKVGLALAGGGVKGSYQIGSYYAFKRCHIKFDGIVGTSIGAANGAILFSGHEKELLDMWKDLKPGKVLNIADDLLSDYNNQERNKTQKAITTIKIINDALKTHGFTTSNIRELLVNLIDIDKLFNSSKDYGLVTYNFSKNSPLYLFKEDMNENNLIDYIIASCSVPVFQWHKVIDDSYYLDGGFIDLCPSNMLIKKNYDLVYEVQIRGIGWVRKHSNGKTKVVTINPSRDTGSIVEMNHDKILDNINMGYFDTLKKLNKFIGYKYTFEKSLFINYNKAVQKVSPFMLRRIYNFFNCNNPQSAILKSLDYVMEKEEYDYNNVYNLKCIIKHMPMRNHFVYEFIKELSI